MGSIFSGDKQTGTQKRDWLGVVLKGKVLPILGLALVVAVTVGIILYRDRIAELGVLGYPGVFLVSMVWNSTVLQVGAANIHAGSPAHCLAPAKNLNILGSIFIV